MTTSRPVVMRADQAPVDGVLQPAHVRLEGAVVASVLAGADLPLLPPAADLDAVDMPLNSIPPTINYGSLALKRAVDSRQLHVDVAFWGGAVPENLGTLEHLWDAGVLGFKCFLLDSGVPEFAPLDRPCVRRRPA